MFFLNFFFWFKINFFFIFSDCEKIILKNKKYYFDKFIRRKYFDMQVEEGRSRSF
jgi:hypothetical protein